MKKSQASFIREVLKEQKEIKKEHDKITREFEEEWNRWGKIRKKKTKLLT